MSILHPSYIKEHQEKFKKVLNEFKLSSFSNQLDNLIDELQEIKHLLEYLVYSEQELEEFSPHIKSKPIDID